MKIEELMKMEKRELDALVARQIFETCPHPIESCGGYTKKEHGGSWIEYNDQYEGKCWDCGADVTWSLSGKIDFACPHYSTDPSADYRVLKHVREKWSDADFDRFDTMLDLILGEHESKRDTLFCSSLYEPGDYSLAALASIEKEKQT